MGFTCGSVVKNPPAMKETRRRRFNPWVGKIPGGRHGNPLQYSLLENPMDRGAWWAAVHGVTRSWTRLRWLSMQVRYFLSLVWRSFCHWKLMLILSFSRKWKQVSQCVSCWTSATRKLVSNLPSLLSLSGTEEHLLCFAAFGKYVFNPSYKLAFSE